jgi:cobaltochelatase CobN
LRHTSSCRANFFSEFAWLQSTISTGGSFSEISSSSAQHDVRVRIAGRAHDGRRAVLVNAQKTVRVTRRAHCVNGNLQAAVGGIFQADGHGKSARHFAVRLRFRGARANRGPRHQIGDVLRHDRIEKLRGRRQTHADNFEQEFSRDLQARFDVFRTVKVRVIDQTFPADGRARYLKINAHDDFHLARKFLPQHI